MSLTRLAIEKLRTGIGIGSSVLLLTIPSTGVPILAQDQQERDKLTGRMDALIQEESSASIVEYEKARQMARDLKALNDEVKDYASRLARLPSAKQDELKLNGTRMNMLQLRATNWNEDSNWPMMNTSTNSPNADWLKQERIRGQRILVRRSDSAPWRYRILIAKNSRNNSQMAAWLKNEAATLSGSAWTQKYPGADQAKAMQDGKLPDWAVHHRVPLYAGDANGGRDEWSNYILLRASDHRDTHSTSGATYREWGPTTLYATRGAEFDDVTSTGDD